MYLGVQDSRGLGESFDVPNEQGLFPDRCQIRQATAYDTTSFGAELHSLVASSSGLSVDAVEDVTLPRVCLAAHLRDA